jgi:hypothetical protein
LRGGTGKSEGEGLAWTIERVDAPREFFDMGERSLALDAAGHPHIAYGQYFLYYARYDGSQWQFETVDDSGKVGEYTSLALDAAGHPHISYRGGGGYLDLRYAYFDGTAWFTTTVDRAYSDNEYTSLALDANGRPHISYYDEYYFDLKYAYVCTAVEQVTVDGSARLPVEIAGLYTATYQPLTATQPLIAWDRGTVGPSAAYSWTAPGTQTLAVTATNGCSQVGATFTVTVFCQPVEEAMISGPGSLRLGETGLYTATYVPITASLPITFTWDNGASGPTAAYSWPATGTYTLTVSATNACGGLRTASLSVAVLAEWPYSVYLPLVLRE